MAEQDWSLNPGRYVGVVIEEDGKTEEEFMSLIDESQQELNLLTDQAADLKATIDANLKTLLEAM